MPVDDTIRTTILDALTGLGLFLVGMLVLTRGLRAAAGDTIHRVLRRSARSPLSGALTGTAMTAALQSSSVTTVATVGFVAAGLLTFPLALGIVFGANLGTTITGWVVAGLGLELDLAGPAGAALLAGVMLRLFGRGRTGDVGWAITGFALIFVGLETLQSALAGLDDGFGPESFPPDTWPGRLALVGIGVLVTGITQSSSAGVATALTALHAGTIDFPQAAALVIGMDLGSTSTTMIATLGGSPPMRRTGVAHVAYNVFTALVGLVLLQPYAMLAERGFANHPALALAGFHTAFNLAGLALVLPWTSTFAGWITRLVPERVPDLASNLDESLLRDAPSAVRALDHAVVRIAAALFERAAGMLDQRRLRSLDEVADAVAAARRYAGRIGAYGDQPDTERLHLTAMHALDHLERMVERMTRPEAFATLRSDDRLGDFATELARALEAATAHSESGHATLHADRVEDVRDHLDREQKPFRENQLAAVADDGRDLDQAVHRLDTVRWLQRTAHHAWRIAHHIETAHGDGTTDGVEREAAAG